MNSQSYVIRNISAATPACFRLGNHLLLIGKSSDNNIILQGEKIPECAAKIEMCDSSYHLEPIGKALVYVNGQKIKHATKLDVGDRIELYSQVLLFDIICNPETTSNEISNTTLLYKLHKLIDTIGKERELLSLLKKLMCIIIEVTGGTEVFIFKLNDEQKPSLFVTTCDGSSQERFSDTVIQNVLQHGKGICIPNALSDSLYKDVGSIFDLKLLSVMCVPITVATKTLGLIYIGCRDASVSFSQNDLEHLKLYATIAGMLINHVDYITQQNDALSKLTANCTPDGMVAESKIMQDLLYSIQSIAESDISVLLEGETGTGKSKIAFHIHQNSHRAEKPFIVVNCSALRGELLESELFGHKKGSFTGAVDDHSGLFAAAHHGTILLDEIGELEHSLQAKLLRTLETNKIRPIGSTCEITIDTRVICATNRNLSQMVAEKLFRADLFYRINQFNIEVPPLRNRGEDILLLSYYFLEKYKVQYPSKDIFDFHPDALRFIQTHTWPGNIRELSNVIHRAILTSKTPLLTLNATKEYEKPIYNFESATKTFQKELIQRAIDSTGGDKEDAAKQLGLTRSTFYRYLSQLGF